MHVTECRSEYEFSVLKERRLSRLISMNKDSQRENRWNMGSEKATARCFRKMTFLDEYERSQELS